MIAYLAIGAVLTLIVLLPVAIGRRRGLPASTRRAIRVARRRYRLQLPDDRVWCPGRGATSHDLDAATCSSHVHSARRVAASLESYCGQ